MLALVWLVGITNAFNLLDNMDGLAATLAAVSCGVFAVDAVAPRTRTRSCSPSRSHSAAPASASCLSIFEPDRPAAVFMGDSGSQVIGFGLASLGLASSWTVAGATLTGMLLPLLVLAIPILDTTLVTIRRTRDDGP